MSIYAMEPMLPRENNDTLINIAVELVKAATLLHQSLQAPFAELLADRLRSMNCYYSNLIENHHTHPLDIEKALADDYAQEPEKRNLQLEAKAHIQVQRWIDQGENLPPAASATFIRQLHLRFCQHLPPALLTVTTPDGGQALTVEPGAWRDRGVQVGRHVAPEAADIPSLLSRFEEVYVRAPANQVQAIIRVAAAHHRLLWIHPFLDGNGRVARLMSHAMLRELGLGSGLWAISRGLARQSTRYKALLMAADSPRQGDLDGRGNLSLQALEDFCQFFLEAALDQVQFMTQLLSPGDLARRIRTTPNLPPGGGSLLWHIFVAGELARGQVAEVVGRQERQCRNITRLLLDQGILVSSGPRSPLRLGLPLTLFNHWFPGLYPEKLFSS